MRTTLVIELRSAVEVTREWTSHLCKGGAYVRGSDADGAVTLVLIGPAGRIELPARTVFRSADGVGLELDGFGPALRDRLEAWVDACAAGDGLDGATIREARPVAVEFDNEGDLAAAPAAPAGAAHVLPAVVEDFDPPTTRASPGLPMVRFSMSEAKEHVHQPGAPAAPQAVDAGRAAATVARASDAVAAEAAAEADEANVVVSAGGAKDAADAGRNGAGPDADADASDADADADADAGDAEADADEQARDPVARTVNERLRNLPIVQQLKVAREGEVHERIALERMYGKTVWEPLLRNPRVTLPEVARIARMGALPRPMLELIVGNTAWLRSPEVRRALLGNLRLTNDMIPRILRLLPKHELRLVPNQSAYALAVRDVARKLLRDQE